jgi:hypothetical protein
MATKNLARTVIEGGRAGFNKWQRYHSHAQARGRARERLRSSADYDALVIPPVDPLSPVFRDKLGPTRRWLRSQRGQPWDQVRSELFARFDTRTTPGRHILFCHMLLSVHDESDPPCRFCREEFRVDGQGILRDGRPQLWPDWRPPERMPEGLDPCGWLAERRVGARGPVLFWFTPTPAGAYRQAGRLSEAECAYWRALPEWYRKQHEPGAPVPVKRN